jgi:hypothetical protein
MGRELMQSTSFTIHFDGASSEAANKYAAELQRELEQASPDVRVEQRKDDKTTQDFGTTLVLVLGSGGAALAVAKGIADWLRKRTGTTITITQENTKVTASGLGSKDAVRIVEHLTGNNTAGDAR